MLPILPTLLSLLLFLSPLTLCANATTNSSSPSAVFVYTHVNQDYQNASAGATQFTFALSLSPSDDLYFHLSAPAGSSWMGVGIGSSMPDSLMIIAYASANGTGVTLSPRIAQHGHSEPSYAPAIQCEKLFTLGLLAPNSVTSEGFNGLDGAIVADGVCRNLSAATWPAFHTLDVNSTAQNFIFAVGPGEKLRSDALDAPLRRHAAHGAFTMDLTRAVGEGASPLPDGPNGTYVAVASSAAIDVAPDNDLAPVAHAVLMCLAFIVVFPTGSLAAKMFRRIMFHAVVQGFGALCVVIGFGIAVHVSGQYNRSRDFRSAHQVLGLLLVCGVVVQFGIGLLQHRIIKKTQTQPKWAKVHLFLGPAIMFLGIVNGGLGIHLANSGYVAKPYIVIVIMVALVYFAFRGSMAWCSRRRRQDKEQLAGTDGVEGYQYPQFHAHPSQYPAPNGPPAYGQSFPMQPYYGQHNVPQTIVYPNKPAGWS